MRTPNEGPAEISKKEVLYVPRAERLFPFTASRSKVMVRSTWLVSLSVTDALPPKEGLVGLKPPSSSIENVLLAIDSSSSVE